MKKARANVKRMTEPSVEIAAQIAPDGELIRSSARHSERCSGCDSEQTKNRDNKRKIK